MNKCTGCGVVLQNVNQDEIGYSKNIDANLCERCFIIINYNEYKEVIKDNNEFIKILENIISISFLTKTFYYNLNNLKLMQKDLPQLHINIPINKQQRI